MPLIALETNKPLDAAQRAALCEGLSRAASEAIGKPEAYVQAIVRPGEPAMRHAGAEGPAAFVEVRSIGGLSKKANGELSRRVCALLSAAGIPGGRVYLNFVDVPAANWGHDGGTFG